ncbi:orotidine-5'-phosphate decarboxylase [Candidatus Poribacteria bacterium]|nr:orotidine-5'-phosphate decarboxylase [Candidatus Poribacteria bacterium]
MDKRKLASKIILALDVPGLNDARKLINQLEKTGIAFKIGFQLFTNSGPKSIRTVKDSGSRLFLDLKFHDIPNTVTRAAEVVTEMGVDMFNVHVSGGMEMMKAAVKGAESKSEELGIRKPFVIGVTMLTSIDQKLFDQVYEGKTKLSNQVLHMAKLAQDAGLDGVVASPQEIEMIRSACGDEFIIVTPGVRPEWSSKDDQKRTMTPSEAISRGASYLVIGRPIRKAHDPAEALNKIIQSL